MGRRIIRLTLGFLGGSLAAILIVGTSFAVDQIIQSAGPPIGIAALLLVGGALGVMVAENW